MTRLLCAASALLASLLLVACAGGAPTQADASGASGTGASGITVYGTADAGIGRSR